MQVLHVRTCTCSSAQTSTMASLSEHVVIKDEAIRLIESHVDLSAALGEVSDNGYSSCVHADSLQT